MKLSPLVQVIFIDPFAAKCNNVQKLYDMTIFQPAERMLFASGH